MPWEPCTKLFQSSLDPTADWGKHSPRPLCQDSGQGMLWDEQAAAARARMWAKSLLGWIFSFSVPPRNHLGCWFAYRPFISTAAVSWGVLSSRKKKKRVKSLKGKNSNHAVRIVKTINNPTIVKLTAPWTNNNFVEQVDLFRVLFLKSSGIMNFRQHWMEAHAHLLVQDHGQAVPPLEILMLLAVMEQEGSTLSNMWLWTRNLWWHIKFQSRNMKQLLPHSNYWLFLSALPKVWDETEFYLKWYFGTKEWPVQSNECIASKTSHLPFEEINLLAFHLLYSKD